MVQLGAAPSNERWVALLHQNMVGVHMPVATAKQAPVYVYWL